MAGAARWHELLLRVPEARVEDVCDALEALEALSVSVEDADAHTPAATGHGRLSHRRPSSSTNAAWPSN